MVEQTDTAKLIEEIRRYLAAVDVFRAAGCEPTWHPERAPDAIRPPAPTGSRLLISDVGLH